MNIEMLSFHEAKNMKLDSSLQNGPDGVLQIVKFKSLVTNLFLKC